MFCTVIPWNVLSDFSGEENGYASLSEHVCCQGKALLAALVTLEGGLHWMSMEFDHGAMRVLKSSLRLPWLITLALKGQSRPESECRQFVVVVGLWFDQLKLIFCSDGAANHNNLEIHCFMNCISNYGSSPVAQNCMLIFTDKSASLLVCVVVLEDLVGWTILFGILSQQCNETSQTRRECGVVRWRGHTMIVPQQWNLCPSWFGDVSPVVGVAWWCFLLVCLIKLASTSNHYWRAQKFLP